MGGQVQKMSSFAVSQSGTANPAQIGGVIATNIAIQCNITVTTPSPIVFTANSGTSVFTTLTAHGLVLGQIVQVSNAGGGLPTGLSAATNYFVIPVDSLDFKLATSLANAQAGTNLTISTVGTGTQTVTATALAGATVALQKSNDGINWSVDGTAVSVTATGTYWLEKTLSTALQYRAFYTLTAGSISSNEFWAIIGDNMD